MKVMLTTTNGLGIHETVELHEILTFKNLCLTKTVTMNKLAQDEELKRILSEDSAKTREQIRQLQDLLS